MILQEFDIEFISSKSKKSLVFAELILELPRVDQEEPSEANILDDHLSLINSSDPWYENILVHIGILKNHVVPYQLLSRRTKATKITRKNCLIINNTLYHQGGDCILRRCLTHEDAEKTINDCHAGACGVHLIGLATT